MPRFYLQSQLFRVAKGGLLPREQFMRERPPPKKVYDVALCTDSQFQLTDFTILQGGS